MTGRDGVHELLSAAVDDEGSKSELRRLLREMKSNPELEAKWARYHVVRGCILQSLPRHRMRSVPPLEVEPPNWRSLAARVPPEWAQDPVTNSLTTISSLRSRRLGWRTAAATCGVFAAIAVTWMAVWTPFFSTPADLSPPVTTNPPPELPSESTRFNPTSFLPEFDNAVLSPGVPSRSLSISQLQKLESYNAIHTQYQSLVRQDPRLDHYVRYVATSPRESRRQ